MSTGVKTNATRKFAVLDVPGVVQKAVACPVIVATSVSAPKSASAPVVAPKVSAVVSEENLYKSVLSIEERVAVAMSVGEEIVTEEELTAMYKGLCVLHSFELSKTFRRRVQHNT